MKASLWFTGLAVLAAMPPALGQSPTVPARESCFSVNIQNDAVNRASVQQGCAHNISRTVQAGADNLAQTAQTGAVNDNAVRQFSYRKLRYQDHVRNR